MLREIALGLEEAKLEVRNETRGGFNRELGH
jgi:hypothetical protein